MKGWHPINWIQWLTLALALFTAFTIPVLYFRVQHVQQHQNDALRSIMCRAETVVLRTHPSAQFTAKQKRQAIRFYSRAISDAHLDPCP